MTGAGAQDARFARWRPITIGARPRLVRHHVADARWTLAPLSIAVVADPHVCAPWVTVPALERIVAQVNGLGADLVLLAGDFIAARQLPGRRIAAADFMAALAALRAPLGRFAVMGNHDWRDCALSRATRFQRNSVIEALAAHDIPLLRNESVALPHGDGRFRLVGLDSQRPLARNPQPGFHRPEEAFENVEPDLPAILLAHEPDYFAEGDARAFLQISGHTHGGQANLFGWRPMTPSRYGGRYGWGHVRESGRHLIVSGGIGYSGLPLRLFQPPEITLITVSGSA
ncbi:metallophosphoesterase [Frigidibacter sp. SD6-1]|uniref:metallophosphoesterase n=1 Tax=Frigidibacter sp. SD6-1 TaxID=3032581 RepID=UPI0024E0268D|nr:metallophosphoesterase [Frigidibacter sp. SD6-1]